MTGGSSSISSTSIIGPPYSRNASTAYQPLGSVSASGSISKLPQLLTSTSMDGPPPPPHTPLGMYSDSEVTIMKPVFGNRPLYAHPLSRDFHRRQSSLQSQQYNQQQQYRSTDDLMENNNRRAVFGIGVPGTIFHQQRRPSQHPLPLEMGSEESDSLSSNQLSSVHHHNQYRKIDYRSLKNIDNDERNVEGSSRRSRRRYSRRGVNRSGEKVDDNYEEKEYEEEVEYEDDEEGTTEYDDASADDILLHHHHNHHHRRRQSSSHHHHQNAQQHNNHRRNSSNNNNGRHSSLHRKHSSSGGVSGSGPTTTAGEIGNGSISRRNSRPGSRRKSQSQILVAQQHQQSTLQDSEMGEDSEETESSGRRIHTHAQHYHQQRRDQFATGNSGNTITASGLTTTGSATAVATVTTENNQSAFTGRPKGSRTLR